MDVHKGDKRDPDEQALIKQEGDQGDQDERGRKMELEKKKRDEDAEWIKRVIDRSGWIDEKRVGMLRSHPLPIRYLDDVDEQRLAWAHESIYNALTQTDRVLAYRSLLLAKKYAGQLSLGARLLDALGRAEIRVEAWIVVGGQS